MNGPFEVGRYNNILGDVLAIYTGSRVGSAFLSAEVTATVSDRIVVSSASIPITIIHDGHSTASIEFDWSAAKIEYTSLGLFASVDTRFQQFTVLGFHSLEVAGPNYAITLRIKV